MNNNELKELKKTIKEVVREHEKEKVELEQRFRQIERIFRFLSDKSDYLVQGFYDNKKGDIRDRYFPIGKFFGAQLIIDFGTELPKE